MVKSKLLTLVEELVPGFMPASKVTGRPLQAFADCPACATDTDAFDTALQELALVLDQSETTGMC